MTTTARGASAQETLSDVDCQDCGACCAGDPKHDELPDRWVQLSVEDFHRLKNHLPIIEEPLPRALPGEPRRFLTATNAQCDHLGGEIGKRTWCTIYDDRPQICAVFPKGSSNCIQARVRHGIK